MQTHKIKCLKTCRELHSLQGNDSIAILCSSASCQQLPHVQQQHSQQPQALHAQQHATHEKGETNCDCSSSTQTHKKKCLKACRKLQSLQVNDLIAILCSSASRQQLPHTQRQHAQQPQATHAHQHKSRNKRRKNCNCCSSTHTTLQSLQLVRTRCSTVVFGSASISACTCCTLWWRRKA